MALEMAVFKVLFFTYWSAPFTPPYQEPAITTTFKVDE
jgi:hypothetical protein